MTASADLDVRGDDRFQLLESRVQHAARIGMGVLVLAAVLGVLGPGPVSRGEISSSDGATAVHYSRIVHRGGPAELAIEIKGHAGTALDLRIDRDWLAAARIEHITPQPVEEALDGDAVRFTMRVAPLGQPTVVRIRSTPLKAGAVRGWLQVGDGERLSLVQVVLP